MPFLWVFLGGGAGSLCRYSISRLIGKSVFPYATLLANALSCIVLGLMVAYVAKSDVSTPIKLFVMVGFCGGFSTYSTFTNETWKLLEGGDWYLAFLNIFGNLLTCLCCLGIGLWLGKSI